MAGILRRLAFGVGALMVSVVLLVIGLQATGQLHTYRITSPSMSNALECGDHVAVIRYWFGSPSRGDVVAFRADPQRASSDGLTVYTKRVVGLPGDQIEIRDGRLLVNGHVADADPVSRSYGPHTVASGSYFVLGDQRDVSDDSRFLGDVPRDAIVGRVAAVYWPLGRLGLLAGHAPSDPGPASC